MHASALLAIAVALALASPAVAAEELKAGDPAPLFTAATNAGESFDLQSRKGAWTVLFFYPKAGTSGCTAQASAFRDGLAAIRAEGAEVYGISVDTVEDQAAFHDDLGLGFPLLADPEGKVVAAYGAKMPIVSYAKRWTFLIGPDLKIRQVERDVDPELDAARVAAEIARLKKSSSAPPEPAAKP